MGIPTGSTGAQMGGWFRKEIKTIDDFKGLKIPRRRLRRNIIAKVGGVPQQIVAGDIYPALEKGTIDCRRVGRPLDDEKLGFVKVAKYYTIRAGGKAPDKATTSSTSTSDALPKQYQAAVETASRDTFTWVTGKYDYVNPPALKRLMARAQSCAPSRRKCWRPVIVPPTRSTRISPRTTRTSTGCIPADAYRSESLAWMQVAELSFDSS